MLCAGYGFTCNAAAMAAGLCSVHTPVGSHVTMMASTTDPTFCTAGKQAQLPGYSLWSSGLYCAKAGCNTVGAITAAAFGSPPPSPPKPAPPLPRPAPPPKKKAGGRRLAAE